jgi:hypothetical protein
LNSFFAHFLNVSSDVFCTKEKKIYENGTILLTLT